MSPHIREKIIYRIMRVEPLNRTAFEAVVDDEEYLEIETIEGLKIYEAPQRLRELAAAIEQRYGTDPFSK